MTKGKGAKNELTTNLRAFLNDHSLLVTVVLLAGVTTAWFRGGPVASLLASATTSLSAPAVTYFTPYGDTVLPVGESIDIDVNVNARVPINAIGETIKFPEDTIEIVGFSKKRSFLDLWTEETAINENRGEVHFSGGTISKGGLVGTGTAMTLSIRAKKPGEAKLYFIDTDLYASDGNGTPVENTVRTITFTIPEPQKNIITASGANGPTLITKQSAPNPDLNGDGRITIVDVSILTVRMLLPFSPRFDLDQDGSIGFGDLSILLSRMNQRI